jgi:hypothetical protein
MSTPINLGPYLLNAPTEVEKGHIRDSLDLGSASLLQGEFLDINRLKFTDPTNSTRSIILDKTLFGSAVADRLRFARAINVTGEVTTSSPIPLFDGTENINIPISINAGAITESKLATDAVVAIKIKDGEITPAKLTARAPNWSGTGSIGIFHQAIELGTGITSNSESIIDFHSSSPIIDYDARIIRSPGVDGALSILNAGTGAINIRGLSVASDNTVTSSRQIIGAIEIIGNQINTTFANNAEIALNYENSDSTIANFLNTTIFNGKREVSAKFFGDTKTLETYGPCRSVTNGQVGWATAGLETRSTSGNTLLALHAVGSTATLLKHVRGGSGLEIRDAGDAAFAPLKASTFTGNNALYLNYETPTIYLQDTNHRGSMIYVDNNIFSIRRSSGNNSTTMQDLNGRWPLDINLETNNATFGADVNAASFTSRSSIRYKKDIQPLQDSLAKVNSLNGVSYVWKETKKADLGLIAEEVNEVYPELVHKTETDEVEGIDYGKLTAVLIEAVKELTGRVQTLEKQLEQR